MSRKLLYFTIYILVFSFSSQLYGQTPLAGELKKIDSLPKREQVKKLSDWCWKNREKITDQAIACGLKAIKIAKAEGYDKELATLYNYVGVLYQHYKYEIQKGISYYDLGLPLSLQVKDSVEIAYVYNNLGDAFYKIGNIPLAFEYAKKSMAIFERLHNAPGIAYSYINMGELNRINEKYDTALVYFRKAIALRQTFNDSIGIASANLEIARTLFLKGKIDSAMSFFRRSLEKHEQIRNKNYMAYSMQGIGDVYLKKAQYDSAWVYFNRALELCRERHNPTGAIDSQLGMAKVLANTGKEQEGEKILDEALDNARKSKLTPNILKVYKAKGEFYHRLKEFQKSSENYQHYVATYDSLYSVLQYQTLSEIKDRFQMTEQLNHVHNDLKSKQKDQLYALVIIILLLLLSAVLILRHRTVSRLSAQLLESNRTKDKVLSIVSHDLVGSFNVLLGTSEMLLEDIADHDLDRAESNGRLIQRTSEDTFRFISNLLTWARSQQHHIRLYPEEFDLSRLLSDVKLMFDSQARMKAIRFQVHAESEVMVNADKNLLQIVLVNLLNNALKFTNRNGTIELSLEREEKQVKVSVRDNGVGISPDRIGQLFRNRTIDSLPGTGNEKGTGLGLYLCKEFVEMHGGEIHVKSVEGEGAEFWFTLPVS